MRETIAVDLILFNKEQLIGDAEMMTTWGENDLLIMQPPGREHTAQPDMCPEL